MRTILIVDDERIIADGLLQIVQETFEDELEAVNTYSASRALDILRTRRIDILLTDIQMPGMSGIDLMKAVKKQWPWCQVIFLTGFTVFEHVYTATQYEDVRYLLKAEGYDKIIATIKDVMNDLMEAELTESTQARAKLLEQENARLQKIRIIENLFMGVGEASDSEIALLDELGFTLNSSESMSLLLLRIDEQDYQPPRSIRHRNIAYLRSLVEEYMGDSTLMEMHEDQNGNLLVLYQPSDSTEEVNCELRVRESIAFIQERVKFKLCFTVSVLSSAAPFALTNLRQKYLELHYYINYVNTDIAERFLTYPSSTGEGSVSHTKPADTKLSSFLFRLEQFLAMGDESAFNETLRQVLNQFAKEQYDTYALISMQYKLAMMLLDHLNLQEGGASKALYLFSDLKQKVSVQEVERFLFALSSETFLQITERVPNENQSIVGILVDYISQNITDPFAVSLAGLADQVHLSPSYLSRLFHQETGVRLSDYISQQRMAAAKRLLHNPKKRINDVASELGFDIPSNFNRFFKKHSGITPLEFQRGVTEQVGE